MSLFDKLPRGLSSSTTIVLLLLSSFIVDADIGLIVGEPLSTTTSDSAGSNTLSFSGRKGVGVVRTFGFPRRHPSDSNKYDIDPYTPRWSAAMPASLLNELRQVGFHFLRIAVDPGPLFESDGDILQKRLDEIKDAIEHTTAAGLKVVIDLHVNELDAKWGFRAVTAGFQTAAFKRYIEVLGSIAKMVSTFDPVDVALEVFNEPPPPCEWRDRPDWPTQLSIIFETARKIAPRHTLLISGSCWSSIGGLTRLDGSKFDANTMFVFHNYSPREFTHQGFWGSAKYLQYLPRLAYPPNATAVETEIQRVTDRIRRAQDIPEGQRSREILQAEQSLRKYFEWKGIQDVEAEFRPVQVWAKRYGVSPNRIILGEFGAMKDVWGRQGASLDDRARWLADMRITAEKFGFAWSVWGLTNTMGLVTGDVDGPLDTKAVVALGLRPQ